MSVREIDLLVNENWVSVVVPGSRYEVDVFRNSIDSYTKTESDGRYAFAEHVHDIADLPPGSTFTINQDRGDFGASPGSWPAVRPSSRSNITFILFGQTKPSWAEAWDVYLEEE